MKLERILHQEKVRRWILFLVLLPYLKPFNVTLIPWLDMIFKVAKVLAVLVTVGFFFAEKKKPSRFTWFAGVFCGIWTASLIVNGNGMGGQLQMILSIIGVCLYFDTFCTSRQELQTIAGQVSAVAKVYIVLNTITVLQQKPLFAEVHEGIAFFFGDDNYFAFILIVLCSIMIARDYLVYQKCCKNTVFFVALALFDLVYRIAYTGIVAFVLLLVLVIVQRKRDALRFANLKTVLLLNIPFVLAVSYLDLQSIMMPFFTLVGKTVGFNGREFIWPAVIKLIQEKFLLGYGYITSEQALTIMPWQANHAHNFVLDILLYTGIIGGAVYFFWIRDVVKNFSKAKNKKYIQMMMLGLTCYFACSVLDFYVGLIYGYLLLAFIYHSSRIEVAK